MLQCYCNVLLHSRQAVSLHCTAWYAFERHVLAGALKLQQNQVAASLVAASQTPQQQSSPAVHVEHLELSAGLRVAGDDAADSVRRRRAKRLVFEKMENVRGLGNVNIVQGINPFYLVHPVAMIFC